MGEVNILVVDDLHSIRVTLAGILEDEGHHVVTVEDGYQAIEAVKKTHFDVIFMDIKMPGINGVQTFREIKNLDAKTAVIMMTAYSVEDLIKEALEEGAYTVVFKPFDIDKIISLIAELLDDKTLILVVDDQFGDREILKANLEEKGYRVATASSGNETLKMVSEKHYKIIFLDIKMPGIDGVATFEQVKKIDPNTAVIMMTGYSVEDLVEKALKGGAYTCIYKPFDMGKITSLLEKIPK